MGIADVIPGVSGGTIAFITGIYDRMLSFIKKINFQAVRILFKEGFKSFWEYIDGAFAVPLFTGILCSVLIFSHVFSYLLMHYALYLWAFFFGLVLMSGLYMLRQVPSWDFNALLSFIVGCIAAYLVSNMSVQAVSEELWVFFVCGSLAVCAMILPGISGSFLLLLLGIYGPVLEAVRQFDLPILMVFCLGCMLGIMSFARLLAWCLNKFRNVSLAFLTGLMLGALEKLWPWKQTIEYWDNGKGIVVPLNQKNVMPGVYEVLMGESSSIGIVIGVMFLAVIIVFLMEYIAERYKKMN